MAVILPVVLEATGIVVIGTVTDVLPAGTVAVAGTEKPAFVVLRETVRPPTGAVLPSATWAFVVVDPVTVLGETVNL